LLKGHGRENKAAGEFVPPSNPHRPRIRRTPGLRARADVFFILSQTDRPQETLAMFFSSLFERVRRDGAGNQTGRPSRPSAWRRAKPGRRNLPRLEILEDRTVPSGYRFQTFDIPGAAQGTQGLDINNLGHVVGRSFDANTAAHGFLGTSSLSILNDPNAANGFQQGTSADGLNDQDQVVGGYIDASNLDHGFLFSQGQFTTMDEPNAVPAPPGAVISGTEQTGINSLGQIVGGFSDASGVTHGFLLSGGQYTTLDDPSAGSGGVQQGTVPIAINSAGQITGWFEDANSVLHGFLLSGGVYTTIDDPNAVPSPEFGTQAFRINSAGQIVGTYTDANKVSHGFLFSGGQFTTIDDPSAGTGFEEGTSAIGINDAGQIVGWYFDANAAVHGFLATPDPASAVSSPASAGGSANALLAAAALTDGTLANRQDIGIAGSFGINHNGLASTTPRQITIIATVPSVSHGSADSAGARVYVLSVTQAGAGKHADTVGGVFEEAALWSLK
jgi:probable HAF family extracellular repeat protein